MAHNLRIRADANWALGTTWLSAELQTLDTNLSRALNGDGGGSWAPSANIQIGGAGLRLISTVHLVQGATSALATNGTIALLSHGDSDYCELGPSHSGATQALVTSVATGVSPPSGRYNGGTGWLWVPFQVLAQPFPAVAAPSLGATLRVPLRVHDGAVLSSVTFPWIVSSGGSPSGWNAIPSQMPKFAVFAKDMFGNTYPLSVASPYQQVPTPSSPAAFYDGGAPQSFTFNCDSPGSNPVVTVNRARFRYFAVLVEAGLGSYPAAGVLGYGDLTATFTNIASIAPR